MSSIIFIGTSHPYRGGLAAFNERLAMEIQTWGHSVRIETFTLQYPGILFPGETQYSDGPAPEDIEIKRSVNSIWPINWISVARRIRREKPDTVILRYWLPFMAPCLGTIARIIKKNGHTRIISLLDNIIPHEKRPGDAFLTRYFVKNVDGFIAMSRSVLSELDLFNTDKPRIYSPHPVFDNFGETISRDAALDKLRLDPSYRYILFFGLIRDYKGLDIMINAFAHKKLRNIKVRLLVVGEFYVSRAPYDELIKKHKLEKEISVYPHFVPNKDVAKWFCASDIIAQPYKSATQSGITQIGYHFNKPMLVTNVGGLSEIIPHGKGGYVVNTDPGEVAEALIDFFSNDRYDDFVRGIKSEKDKYRWDKMVKNLFLLDDSIKK
ncbi:MAG TPA: glycosyl transferase family 1 [Bacteroidales bacterium]|nr:glycosyl transferase family 1 [Bacteroidales bacterium]